jgi:Alcohol dehydrogenase GroES-associated
MRAVVYHGKRDVRVDTVPDPTIEQPCDRADHLDRDLRI